MRHTRLAPVLSDWYLDAPPGIASMTTVHTIPSQTRSEGQKTGADLAMELLREQLNTVYREGYSAGYKDGEDAFRSKIADLARDINAVIGNGSEPVVTKGQATVASDIAPSTKHRAKRPRAAPGSIEMAIAAVFTDGKRRSIKEMHDALIARGDTASREGVARVLRHSGRYSSDGRSYFPIPGGDGETAAGAKLPGDPQPSSI